MKVNRLGRPARTLAIALALFAVTGAAAPQQVSAQSLSGGGFVRGVAECHFASRVANVWVSVQLPDAIAATGNYFYTEIWAKARSDVGYNRINAAYSPLITTATLYTNPFVPGGTMVQNAPKTILFGSFSGRINAYYDIQVKWWAKAPGGQWGGPYVFNLKGDPHSSFTYYSNDGYGNIGSPATDCYL